VAAIVGLGAACALAAADVAAEVARLGTLRDELQRQLLAAHPDAVVHAHDAHRLPNTLSIAFPDRTAAAILARLERVAVSAGAACHGDGDVGSHVLAAMGVPARIGRGTLRVSLGRPTTRAEIDEAARAIAQAASSAR